MNPNSTQKQRCSRARVQRGAALVVFSLVSAFSHENKTYKIGLGVRVSVSVWVWVCVCVKFWSPPNNFQTTYLIDTKFWLHIVRTGTLQRRYSRFSNFKIVPGRNVWNSFFLHLINMGKFSNSLRLWYTT